jgi:hypothetical protein
MENRITHHRLDVELAGWGQSSNVPIILVMALIPAVKKPAAQGTFGAPAAKAAPPHSSTYVTAFLGLVFYF